MYKYAIKMWVHPADCWLPAFSGRGEYKKGENILFLTADRGPEYARQWALSVYPEAYYTVVCLEGKI